MAAMTLLDSGFIESVITTQNPQPWIDLMTRLGGWEIRDRSPLDRGLIELWQLPSSASGNATLLANRGEDRGFIRLVELAGVSQDWIRIDDRPWDTGGIFDLNLRVVNLRQIREGMLRLGWVGEAPPDQYVFGDAFEVIEWIARGPDGVRFALIERIRPPLVDWPHLKRIGRNFNSTMVVRDLAAARRLFVDALGMRPALESKRASAVRCRSRGRARRGNPASAGHSRWIDRTVAIHRRTRRRPIGASAASQLRCFGAAVSRSADR
jgi:hypothetical protein